MNKMAKPSTTAQKAMIKKKGSGNVASLIKRHNGQVHQHCLEFYPLGRETIPAFNHASVVLV
jgi:hypothetical protein